MRLVSVRSLRGIRPRSKRLRERVRNRLAYRQALDALRTPLGGDLGAGHTPDLFGVGLEKRLVEPDAEPIDEKILERHLGMAAAQLRPTIAQAPTRSVSASPIFLQRVGVQLRADNRKIGADRRCARAAHEPASLHRTRPARCCSARNPAIALGSAAASDRRPDPLGVLAATGRISCHQRMTQSDFEKNRWPPRSMRLPR